MIVDIEAVDTHRPKPTKKVPTINKPKQDIKKNGTSTTNGSAALLGASGEIVNDFKSPILPISPQLWPSTSNTTVTANGRV